MDEPARVAAPMGPLRSPQFLISIGILALVAATLGFVMLGKADDYHDLQIVVVTAVVVRGLEALVKYWLNSTNDSEKKTDTISTLATQNSNNGGSGNGNGAAAPAGEVKP